MTDGKKLEQFNARIVPEIKAAFKATKPKGITMQKLVEASFKHWCRLPAKERQKYLMR
jgi:hypothetical protein